MEKCSRSQDEALVKACLAGSEVAWQEFYSRFIGLMRSVVKKRFIVCKEDVEDITQSAFVSLATALNNFDYEQSLPRFVCVITERVAIDEDPKWKRGQEECGSADRAAGARSGCFIGNEFRYRSAGSADGARGNGILPRRCYERAGFVMPRTPDAHGI